MSNRDSIAWAIAWNSGACLNLGILELEGKDYEKNAEPAPCRNLMSKHYLKKQF